MEANVIASAGAARPPLTANQLAERVFPAVERYCQKYAPARDADDIVQTVMVKLSLRADTIDQTRPDFDPIALAFGLAKYATMNARRSAGRFLAFTDLADEDDRPFDPEAKQPAGPDEKKETVVNRVRAVLSRLPAPARKFIDSRFVFGRTAVETAAKLGRTTAYVNQQMAAAMERAKELLEVCP